MAKYIVKNTTILHSEKTYGAGATIELTDEEAARLSAYITPAKATAQSASSTSTPASNSASESSTPAKTTATSKKSSKKNEKSAETVETADTSTTTTTDTTSATETAKTEDVAPDTTQEASNDTTVQTPAN